MTLSHTRPIINLCVRKWRSCGSVRDGGGEAAYHHIRSGPPTAARRGRRTRAPRPPSARWLSADVGGTVPPRRYPDAAHADNTKKRWPPKDGVCRAGARAARPSYVCCVPLVKEVRHLTALIVDDHPVRRPKPRASLLFAEPSSLAVNVFAPDGPSGCLRFRQRHEENARLRITLKNRSPSGLSVLVRTRSSRRTAYNYA